MRNFFIRKWRSIGFVVVLIAALLCPVRALALSGSTAAGQADCGTTGCESCPASLKNNISAAGIGSAPTDNGMSWTVWLVIAGFITMIAAISFFVKRRRNSCAVK